MFESARETVTCRAARVDPGEVLPEAVFQLIALWTSVVTGALPVLVGKSFVETNRVGRGFGGDPRTVAGGRVAVPLDRRGESRVPRRPAAGGRQAPEDLRTTPLGRAGDRRPGPPEAGGARGNATGGVAAVGIKTPILRSSRGPGRTAGRAGTVGVQSGPGGRTGG